MVPYVHARRLRHQPIAYLRLQIGVALLLLVVIAVSHIDLPQVQRQPEIVYLPDPSVLSSISAASVADSSASSLAAVLVLPPAYAQPAGPSLPIAPPRTRASVSVFGGPGSEYAIVGLLPGDAALQVVGRDASGEWLAVAFPPGSSFVAWLPAAQVSGMAEQPAPKLLNSEIGR